MSAFNLRKLSEGPKKEPYKKESTDFELKKLNCARCVFTGTIPKISRLRAGLYLLSKYSSIISPNVTSTTDYLIVGEDPGMTKINQAKKLNIPIIDYKQIFK